MPLVFEVDFSTSVITRIESIGGGWVGGEGGERRWGAVGGLKQALKQKWQCCAISRSPRLAQLTRSAVRISLAPHAGPSEATHAMKCTLLVLQCCKKAVYKSRPGHLVSSAWCLWIVHECGIHLQAKNGFQYL